MGEISYTIFLVTGMLITGACNTLLSKLQDKQCVNNCDGSNPEYFEQPVFQTLNMFFGETLCLIASIVIQFCYRKKYDRLGSDAEISHIEDENEHINENDNENEIENVDSNNTTTTNSINKAPLIGKARLLLWCPSIFDICGTTLMNIGLIYIAASVYQMLRGAVVIFTGIFSVLFLKRKLKGSQWIALFIVMIGVSIVGLSNIITKSNESSSNGNGEYNAEATYSSTGIIGVVMVLLAQVATALQFITEEKIMSNYEIGPLKTVGMEGLFGLSTVLISTPFLHIFIGRNHPGGFFDFPNGLHQILNIPVLFVTSIGCILSIAFFNWFGLSVTNAISATSRSTIDTCRTILIWMISLYLGWETFNWFQVLGFIVLIYGTFLFNGVVNLPNFNRSVRPVNERRPLLDETPLSSPTN